MLTTSPIYRFFALSKFNTNPRMPAFDKQLVDHNKKHFGKNFLFGKSILQSTQLQLVGITYTENNTIYKLNQCHYQQTEACRKALFWDQYFLICAQSSKNGLNRIKRLPISWTSYNCLILTYLNPSSLWPNIMAHFQQKSSQYTEETLLSMFIFVN